MKALSVVLKVVLLLFYFLVSVAILDQIKRSLMQQELPPLYSSVMWMSFPIVFLVAVSLFSKNSLVNNGFIVDLLKKIRALTEDLIVGRIIVYMMFSFISFMGALLLMFGIHILTLSLDFTMLVVNVLISCVLCVLGLFFLLLSNQYFKL
ncbi:MAG: hypothetical protein ACRDCS_09755 [Tannerellaceae bacterium]